VCGEAVGGEAVRAQKSEAKKRGKECGYRFCQFLPQCQPSNTSAREGGGNGVKAWRGGGDLVVWGTVFVFVWCGEGR
jgi:hypothetical protein